LWICGFLGLGDFKFFVFSCVFLSGLLVTAERPPPRVAVMARSDLMISTGSSCVFV
jgi:hypothetical protein